MNETQVLNGFKNSQKRYADISIDVDAAMTKADRIPGQNFLHLHRAHLIYGHWYSE